ncbi:MULTISPECIES: cell wall hydrolase [Actibacterium]|uniref:Spore germination cell wall hydrolase CwlJ-like protein n=1 Tax=Actibacterium naphthalenivorans TaxID=1614693 RepID=A0A840CIJ7_9RHOB|nr:MULTISPECIES: cell wall hydrolase [Actibacterium]ALG90748.1 hypothetical protein TQ29_11830 [Actibacterium sp. EMB200-NS6]MBB4023039.1 spore germination cell wall hydrolase CwlJ-like protein [Actibacterium naphthalenivorans]
MSFRLSLAFGIAALVVSSISAQADISASSSNDPTAVAGEALARQLGIERTALGQISDRKLKQLATYTSLNAPTPGGSLYDRSWLDRQPAAKGGKQWQCLSEALYFEARGESVRGQFAVAEVILNRVASPNFPDTVCGVVHQGTGRKFQCQFTYNCDGQAEVISEPAAYDRVGKVARIMMDGAPRALTGGATFYHTRAVKPRWSRVFTRTASIGVHYFYRKPTRVSSN